MGLAAAPLGGRGGDGDRMVVVGWSWMEGWLFENPAFLITLSFGSEPKLKIDRTSEVAVPVALPCCFNNDQRSALHYVFNNGSAYALHSVFNNGSA